MWTSGSGSRSANIGSKNESLTHDYKDYHGGWQVDFDCLAIARHNASDFSGVKVWKMKDTGLTTFAQYFNEDQDEAKLIATEGGPVQIDVKSDATNVDIDPILASNGTENNLAFNWKYGGNNGVRVVLTDVGHHSGTLQEDINDDGNHGLGNAFNDWDYWEHDASVIQGDCFAQECTVQ
eukprot:scaffold422990_cov46-Attheya_sp.AAC.1